VLHAAAKRDGDEILSEVGRAAPTTTGALSASGTMTFSHALAGGGALRPNMPVSSKLAASVSGV
jgi:hypothetical protein